MFTDGGQALFWRVLEFPKLDACLPNIQPRLPSAVALDFCRLLSQGFPHCESIFADSHLVYSAFQQAANILVHFKSLLEKMSRGDFAKYCDATKSEKGVSQVDSGSSHNLFKLLVATEKAGYISPKDSVDSSSQVWSTGYFQHGCCGASSVRPIEATFPFMFML